MSPGLYCHAIRRWTLPPPQVGVTLRRWVMSSRTRGRHGLARVGSLRYRHPAGLPQAAPPVKVGESGPSWTAKGRAGLLGGFREPALWPGLWRGGGMRPASAAGRPSASQWSSPAIRRKAALACSTTARIAPGTNTSTRRDRVGPRRDGRLPAGVGGLSVLYQGGPERAACAAAWARVRRSAGAPTPATQHARRLARRAGSPEGPPHDDSSLTGWWAGSRPGRASAAQESTRRPRRRAGGGYAVAATAPPAGALRLQDGRGCVGGSRSVGGCGGPHPVCHRPGRAEQTTARPASVRTSRQGSLDVAGRAAARSPEGGSTADGMGRSV